MLEFILSLAHFLRHVNLETSDEGNPSYYMLIEYRNTWPLAHVFLHFANMQYENKHSKFQALKKDSMNMFLEVILKNTVVSGFNITCSI